VDSYEGLNGAVRSLFERAGQFAQGDPRYSTNHPNTRGADFSYGDHLIPPSLLRARID
jgi:hypothetical protein